MPFKGLRVGFALLLICVFIVGAAASLCACSNSIFQPSDGSTPGKHHYSDGTVHTHTFAGWQYNKQKHWKVCDCGANSEAGYHWFEDDECVECGYKRIEFAD